MLDGLRVIALPKGAEFQFRYRTEHVPKYLTARDDKGALTYFAKGTDVLLVAANQKFPVVLVDPPIEFAAIRFAQITRAEFSGGLLRVSFVVAEYCKDMALPASGSSDETDNDFKWPFFEGGQRTGHYVVADNRVAEGEGNRRSDHEDPLGPLSLAFKSWPGFKSYPLFKMSPPRRHRSDDACKTKRGAFRLTERCAYALDVTHARQPNIVAAFRTAKLELQLTPSDNNALLVEEHALDSRLNVHRFVFSTKRRGPMILSLGLVANEQTPLPLFDLHVEGMVGPNRLWRLGLAAVTGTLAAIPTLSAIAAVYYDPDGDSGHVGTLWWILLATFLVATFSSYIGQD